MELVPQEEGVLTPKHVSYVLPVLFAICQLDRIKYLEVDVAEDEPNEESTLVLVPAARLPLKQPGQVPCLGQLYLSFS